MKKILYFMSALAVVLGMAACSAEDDIIVEEPTNVPEVAKQMTIVANIEDQTTTRASLSGDDTEGYQVLWSEGDQININVRINEEQTNFTYTLTEGAGTKRGTFTGPALPDGEYTAGYGENLSMANSGNLKGEQFYSSSNNACCAPMMANVTVVDGVATVGDFKNIGGLLRLDLKGSGIVKEIKVTTTQAQAGLISLDDDGAAYVRIYPGIKSVTLNCGQSGVELTSTAKPFYISMLKNDYTGVKIEITDFNNHTCTKTLKADKTLNIARAQITPVSLSVTGLTNENIPLTWDSPVGARGTLDGQECVVVDLGGNVGKVAIATKNVGAANENAYGTYMTAFDAALAQKNESWGKGWHMPSLEELKGFNTFYNNASRTHNSTNHTVTVAVSPTSSLIFPITGFYDVVMNRYEGQGEYMEFIGCHFVGSDGGTPLSPGATDIYTCGLHGYNATSVLFDYGSQCTDKRTIRPFHKLPITRNTPVGMVGCFDGRDAMVVEVTENGAKKKVCIATKNEGASSETIYYEQNGTKYLDCIGSYYTYAQAEALCTDGWYIPTWGDYEALYRSVTYDTPKDGFPTNTHWKGEGYTLMCYTSKFHVTENIFLNIACAGYADGPKSRGERGCYWTSTADENDNAKNVVLDLAGGIPFTMVYSNQTIGTYDKTTKNSVRLFHAMPK